MAMGTHKKMETLNVILPLLFILISGLSNVIAEHVLIASNDAAICAEGQVRLHRGCYLFNSKRVKKEEARDVCQGRSGNLTSIQSVKEKEALESHLKRIAPKGGKWWVDLSKKSGAWRWGADQSVVDEKITQWKSNAIRDRPGNTCGFYEYKSKTFWISNSRCHRKKGYICEFHTITPRPTTKSVVTEKITHTNSPASTTSTLPTSGAIGTKSRASPVLPNHSTQRKQTTHRATDKTPETSSPFTYPPKTKRIISTSVIPTTEKAETSPVKTHSTSQSDGVHIRTSRSTSSFVTSSSSSKATSLPSMTTVDDQSEKSVQTTTHSEGFRVRTTARRQTPSLHSTPTSTPLTTTTSDDSSADEADSDDAPTTTKEQEDKADTETSTLPRKRTQTTSSMSRSSLSTVMTKSGSNSHSTKASQDSSSKSSSSPSSSTDDSDEDDDQESTTEQESSPDEDEDASTDSSTTRRKGPNPTSPVTKKFSPKLTTRKFVTQKRSRDYWLEALRDFNGCYIPGTRASPKRKVLKAMTLYPEDADHCPAITISRLTFPRTEAGETATVKCRKGSGVAKLDCSEDKVCWEDQPDMSGCASPRFKALLKKVKEVQAVPGISPKKTDEEVVNESVNTTSELLTISESEDVSMEDILATSEVLAAFTHTADENNVKTRDKTAVKKIVGNMIKTSSNLLSRQRKALWRGMDEEEKVRSTSSLSVAVETATLSAAEMIEEPAVITQVEENLEMEIQVLDVDDMEREHKEEVVFDADQSDNTFSIPVENLKSSGGGKLAKVVFIAHYSMSAILNGEDEPDNGSDEVTQDGSPGGRSDSGDERPNQEGDVSDPHDFQHQKEGGNEDEEEESSPRPRIASCIMSATIGGTRGHTFKLTRPVTFSMRHTVNVTQDFTALCSFWDLSQGSGQGFWSQEGCRVTQSTRSHTTCECDHLTSFAILIDVHGFEISESHQTYLRVVTIVGCVISCVCLLASWITFQFCSALQGERNSIHKNLAVTLFIAELLFVTGVAQTEDKTVCSAIAVCLHFFFLSAFTWMFLEGLHIIVMLVQVFEASRSRLPFYYAVGYGIPAIVVLVSSFVYFPGYGTDAFCWLTADRYFIWAFAGPVALILLVNTAFLTYAMTAVCQHSDYVFNAKDRSTGSPIRSWIQGALALEVLLGLTWVLGYFLMNSNALPLAYVFAVLNSLQGLFIFVFHCLLNKKAQKEYLRLLRAPLSRFSLTPSSQSTFAKRSNSRSRELTHSNSRKLSLSYGSKNSSNGHAKGQHGADRDSKQIGLPHHDANSMPEEGYDQIKNECNGSC